MIHFSLDNFRSTLFPKPPQNSTSSENSTNSGHMIFRDFLREQIDNLMTGDGRDGLAEGRRGTHVEVTFSAVELCAHILTVLFLWLFTRVVISSVHKRINHKL